MDKVHRDELYAFIVGILENKKCHPYRINGVEDHIHILTHIHPTVSLSSLVKDIKVSTSLFIKDKQLFPNFTSWQEGYGAFSFSKSQLSKVIEYIEKQEDHHRKKTFIDEYKDFLEKFEIEFDERYIFKPVL